MGRHKKYEDLEMFEQKIKEYFEECDKHNKPYTISGLALSLDLDRKTILNYSKDDKYFPTIKKAKLKIENQLEECLYRLGNNSGVIFNLKNNYGWKDKSEVEVRKDPIEDLTPLAELLKGEKDEPNSND